MGSRGPPGHPPEGSRGGSGGLLGGSWEPLGELLAEMREEVNIRSFLEASWGRLGGVLCRSWGHLGAILAPSWGLLGPSWDHIGST